jgi:hypothetical protein
MNYSHILLQFGLCSLVLIFALVRLRGRPRPGRKPGGLLVEDAIALDQLGGTAGLLNRSRRSRVQGLAIIAIGLLLSVALLILGPRNPLILFIVVATPLFTSVAGFYFIMLSLKQKAIAQRSLRGPNLAQGN